MTRTRGTCGMLQVNRPALLLGDDRVISNRWLSSSSSSLSLSSIHDGGSRDVSAGRTMLGRAAIHLNVHGALTNCATCIVATGGGCCARPIGQLLDFARERTVKWHSGGGGFWKSVTRAYFYSPPDLHVGEKRHRGEFYETRLHRQTRNCRKILIDLSSWFANRFTKVICYAFRFLRLDPIDVVWFKNWFMYYSGSAAEI